MTQEIRTRLLLMADAQYGSFSKSLIPECKPLLGVRLPALRKMAQEFVKNKEWKELVQSERVKKIISEDIKKRGERLAEYERIKRFKILENSFSHEKGEMSHTLKLKRNVIQANYAKEIAELFNI